MKLIIKTTSLILSLFIIAPTAYAVTPTAVKVIAEQTNSTAYEYQVNKVEGEGNWTVQAKLSESLEFWNVGEEGGAQYATAILTQKWIPQGNGEVLVKGEYVKSQNRWDYYREPAKSAPDIPTTVSTLTFTGGLDGKFINESGDVTKLKIVSDGKGGFLVSGSNLALFIRNPEAFDAWRTEEDQMKDSGMRFSGMTGQVEWRADNDPDGWKLCKPGDILPVYAHIRTQEDSSAILSFAREASTFVLRADSEVVIDAPAEKESKMKLVAGNIWANVKKIVKDGSMSIEMNQAVCGIKGTTFVLEERNGVSSLKVIEGKVEFTAKVGGAQTMVEGGSMVATTPSGLGTVETFDVEKESKIWEEVMTETASTTNPTTTPTTNNLYYILGLIALVLVVGAVVMRRNKKNN